MADRRRMMVKNGSHVDENGMITDSWDMFIANIKAGEGPSLYQVGNYIPLDLGSNGTFNMEILTFHPPWIKADLSATPEVLLMAKELTNFTFNKSSNNMTGVDDVLLKALDETLFPLLPKSIQDSIVPVILYRYTNSYSDAFKARMVVLEYSSVRALPIDQNITAGGYLGQDTYRAFLIRNTNEMIKYVVGTSNAGSYPVLHSDGGGNYGAIQSNGYNTQVQYAQPCYLPLGFCL